MVTPVPEVLALQTMFEGLYARALRPTGAFKEALRAKGYDLDHQKPSYPLAVWAACLDVSAGELYPGESRAAAWQQLGRRFIEGYFQTLVGRLIATTLPFMSAKLFLGRVPRFMTTGLEGADAQLEWHDAHRVTLSIRGVHELSAAVMAGVLAGSFERMRISAVKLEPRSLTGLDAELVVTLP